jgi:oligopeptide/dipeptide ABC transporter ATP-binding protein
MSSGNTSDGRLLLVRGLKTYFHTEDGIVRAVDDISFQIDRGQTLGVVGESGCGKSVTSLSIMQLVPRPRGRIEDGEIRFRNRSGRWIEITALQPTGAEMRGMRGNEIAMIFQEPMTSLNPVYTVGNQIMEAIRLHQMVDKEAARERAIEMLDRVGIAGPRQRISEYPHQLSGGMRQRAMIAMALSCNPTLLIADEPTTALDVTIEAQILRLMRDLQREYHMAIMFITHDLSVIAEMAERVVVMYTGRIVEEARTDDIFHDPLHPYTRGLLKSRPRIGTRERLSPIEGSVPSLKALPRGCPFAPRCPQAFQRCHEEVPPEFDADRGRRVACWLHEQGGGS